MKNTENLEKETHNKKSFFQSYAPCFNFELGPEELIKEGLKRGFITQLKEDTYLVNDNYKPWTEGDSK